MFGVFYYKNSYNLGDNIQTIAALRFLPKVDALVDRDSGQIIRLNENFTEGQCKVIYNGWFDGNYCTFPPPSEILPLFVAFHINESDHSNDKSYSILNQFKIPFKTMADNKSYFDNYAPIGCRDNHTKELLQSYGVNAYFSGCLTLTLRRPDIPRTNDIVVIDSHKLWPEIFEKLIPKSVRDKAKYHVQAVPYLYGNDDKLQMAQELLDRIASAKLVITTRLHSLLPSIAYKTPVIFLHNDLSDIRFKGYRNICKMYDLSGDPQELIDLDLENYTWEQMENDPTLIVNEVPGWVANIESRIAEFVDI